MTSLLGRFDEFYQAVYGVTPFPWQTRLAASTADGHAWPAWLALPTATGKTACIDIAVFALACQAGRRPEDRTAPRRIFFVIDRRVVVHQAYQRASALAAKLEFAESGIVAEVAVALRHIGGAHTPLRAFQLRGGIYRDEAWVRSPVQPTVIASTVDQIGSRLLFRGYGLRRGYDRPIHAALVTNDALIILDEAHCAEPFRQTVEACRAYRAQGVHMPTTPFDFSVMSATPPVGATGHLFALDNSDLQHPVITARLGASKPARLVEAASGRGAAGDRRFAQAIANEALGLGGRAPRAVGVIVNRVATARAVHEILDAKAPGTSLLLTGRMRMVDRDGVMADLAPLQTGATRPASERTRYVVATQCIEVGADLDFDALVTECASLDALRQRFGRLNRAGRDTLADAAIVIRSDQAKNEDLEKQDPVYGASLTEAWAWLNSVAGDGVVNLGITAIERLLSGVDRTPLESPRVNAPVMLPAYLGAWVQTSPAPAPDPDVAVFLHGPQSGPADVMVCFRSDLCRDPKHGQDVRSRPSSAGTLPLESAIELLAACPPTSRECMSLPLAAVRRWLVGEDAPSGADVEGVESSDDEEVEAREGQEVDRLAFAWRGADDTVQVSRANVRMLRPGDTLVVPTQLPGWQHLGHVPVDGLRSPDVGDECHTALRLRPVMRLTNGLAADWGPAAEKTAADLSDGQEVDEVVVSELLASVRDNIDLASWRRVAADCLLADRNRVAVVHPAGGLLIRVSRLPSRVRLAKLRAAFSDVVVEDLLLSDDESSAASVEVPLEAHLNGVREVVGSICREVGLPATLAGDLMLAASLHDIGKADPRFQAWLRGGHRFLSGLEPLAKSGGLPTSPRERSAARTRAGYPKGGRHELLSLRLADASEAALATAEDLDLVLHLIASHHGRCRPFAPVVQDPEGSTLTCSLPALGIDMKGLATGLEQFDSGVAERFWSLNERYGIWGLAWLETLLRLGDRIRSEREQIENIREEATEGRTTWKGITLTGLDGANPLGFLAALGVLSTSHDLDTRVQLSWRAGTQWHPVLHTPADLDDGGLAERIADALAGESVRAFEVPSGAVDKPVADNLTVSGTAFREFASSQTTNRGLDFASAFACDALVDENGRILDSAFRTMSGAGHQHFLKSMRDLALGTTPAHIEEALFGPWQYGDDPPIMRWDPDDDRRYALRWREPSGDPIRTVRGANRLAIEGLRFFPTMPVGRRLETTGIIGSRASDTYFTWPIWTCAVRAPVIRSLLAMPELRGPSPTVEAPTRADLLARGIVEVFRSQRITVGKFRNFGRSAAL